MSTEIYRGDIYYANLTPAVGGEMGGIRPVIILRGNIPEDVASPETVIVAGILNAESISGELNPLLYVKLPKESGFLFGSSIISLSQVRTISTQRLLEYFGKVAPEIMEETDKKLKNLLGI